MKPWITSTAAFVVGVFLACCEISCKNTSLTEADTTQILQLLLTDPNLDKQLNGFREKQLKIVQNKTINKQYNLYKNGQIVLLSAIDSTNEQLINPYKPAFFLEVSKFEISPPNKACAFFIFKGTGLTLSAELKKQEGGFWQIVSSTIGFI
ncbi:hypothetical protein [Runella salmonicolor]|uniref:Lumazine-binding n=1 Tax=Runella salmonicolor TaxID=2950278 RepID=A0ABT1FW34_9BACT|nr:hypothetical protein [Runella salmonicolor]MCP1384988.1 hypothetical protein [Runella salmonicolor]